MNALIVMLIALAAAMATMTGGLLTLKLTGRLLPLVTAFSAGAVIGVAFFDLAPEAFAAAGGRYGAPVLLAVIGLGFFLYTLLDRLVARHDCEGHYSEDQSNPARGLIGAASFSAHSVLDGFAIGIAYRTDPAIGLVVAAAVLAHDFADGLNTVTVVTGNGGSRGFALRWLMVDAAAPLLGAALSLLVTPDPNWLALLLALFCGFFLQIGSGRLLPESQRAWPRPATTLAAVAGAGLLYVVTTLAR